MRSRLFNYKFPVKPSEAVVLLKNVLDCSEAENDADNTVEDLIFQLDRENGYAKKAIVESCLYCCNIQNESGKFWHHLGWSFEKFVEELLPQDCTFDFYYNLIREKEGRSGPYAKTRG